jgi:hypothetical protein
MTSKTQQTRYASADRREFLLLRTWCSNEEPDAWVEYTDTTSGQYYTCRLEAFLSRFSPLVD